MRVFLFTVIRYFCVFGAGVVFILFLVLFLVFIFILIFFFVYIFIGIFGIGSYAVVCGRIISYASVCGRIGSDVFASIWAMVATIIDMDLPG